MSFHIVVRFLKYTRWLLVIDVSVHGIMEGLKLFNTTQFDQRVSYTKFLLIYGKIVRFFIYFMLVATYNSIHLTCLMIA